MKYMYLVAGVAERDSVFHLDFRRHPFGGGHAIAAGLGPALDYLEHLRFDPSDCEYLAGVRGADGKPLFEPGFIDYLADLRFRGTVEAFPEGRLCFAHEPLVRVHAPILLAGLIEPPLLTMINFSTLIATKAARVCQAARGEPVLEFGLRRAQAISVVDVAVILDVEQDAIKSASITLGAVTPIITHAEEAEKYLAGKPTTEEVFEEAARLAMAASRPIDDVRGSAAYRKEMVRVCTLRGHSKRPAVRQKRIPGSTTEPIRRPAGLR